MEILEKILIGAYVIICFILIVLALTQSKNDEGVSGAIVGGSSSNFFEKNKGRTKEGKMKKWTIILSVVFVILNIVIGIIYMM